MGVSAVRQEPGAGAEIPAPSPREQESWGENGVNLGTRRGGQGRTPQFGRLVLDGEAC